MFQGREKKNPEYIFTLLIRWPSLADWAQGFKSIVTSSSPVVGPSLKAPDRRPGLLGRSGVRFRASPRKAGSADKRPTLLSSCLDPSSSWWSPGPVFGSFLVIFRTAITFDTRLLILGSCSLKSSFSVTVLRHLVRRDLCRPGYSQLGRWGMVSNKRVTWPTSSNTRRPADSEPTSGRPADEDEANFGRRGQVERPKA